METTTTTTGTPRRAAVNALAVVGFIALLFIGIAIAIYGARYIPDAFSRLGTASVSLFKSNNSDPSLDVVAATTTIPFTPAEPEATTTLPIAPASDVTTATPTSNTSNTTTTHPVVAGTPRTVTVPVLVNVPQQLYGNPDLLITITSVGYLQNDSTDSFVPSPTVPSGKRGAVQFTVRNAGTNASGNWTFRADIPSSPSFTFDSPSQQSLLPNDRIDFTLGFDRAYTGDRTVTITVDPNNYINESNESNNSAARTLHMN